MSKSIYRQKQLRPIQFFGLNGSWLILATALCTLASHGCNTADTSSTDLPISGRISAEVAMTLLSAHEADPDFLILDVRTPGEFAPEHLRNATNIDFNAPHFEEAIKGLNRGNVYLVYCGSGLRSGQAAELMKQLGFPRVYDLEGGLIALKQLDEAQLPLESCGCD